MGPGPTATRWAFRATSGPTRAVPGMSPAAPRAARGRTTSDGRGRVGDDDRQILQRFVDTLFREALSVSRLDAIVRAEALDLPPDLLGIIELLPPGTFGRQGLCDQLNSALKGHGWTGLYGTVE